MTVTHHPVAASLLAKWFVARVGQDPEQDLSNLKLQKLLYLAHSLFLDEQGVPLVKEDFQAWNHGPVINVLYQECKPFGDGPVRWDLIDDGPWSKLDNDVTDVLERTWDSFGGYSALKLREITHEIGPWKQTYKTGVKYLVIPDESIGAAWAEFAQFTEKSVGGDTHTGLTDALAHFEGILQDLPAQQSKGDPAFLLDELDSLEALRKHAAHQVL